jgi:hypothetical protein
MRVVSKESAKTQEVLMGGQRVRGLFAIVGGSAVAVAAAVIVVISAVPERGQNGCALIPSIQGCTPPLNSGNSFPTGNVTLPSVIPQDTVNALPTR